MPAVAVGRLLWLVLTLGAVVDDAQGAASVARAADGQTISPFGAQLGGARGLRSHYDADDDDGHHRCTGVGASVAATLVLVFVLGAIGIAVWACMPSAPYPLTAHWMHPAYTHPAYAHQAYASGLPTHRYGHVTD